MNKNKCIVPNEFFGVTKDKLIEFCLNSDFPGNTKWPADHPIWHCNVAGHITPYKAWKDRKSIELAVDNLYWILNKSINIGPRFYPEFVTAHEKAFKAFDISLLRKVLARFTIAKIAPKVTALRPTVFLDIIEQSGVDLSPGVYCPMAGFGGIIEGTKRWFKNHNIPENIEAYDINKNFCDYYGWKQRDVLAQDVTTDKILIACPPFGLKTERWEGTPDEMYYDFDVWCDLLKKHIKAKNYILIGPEINQTVPKYQTGVDRHALFRKKIGIQLYPQYLI